MRDVTSAAIGKTVRQVARLRGGGSALPGLVVEKIDPGFLGRVLGRLPYGVVAISGTNGKTTTTKMVVEMLEAEGLRVFTNRTGSNFSRGVVAAAIAECDARGQLAADIAVLELDEAHAMYFIDRVPPRFSLLLNVLRDQLDRFGELDTTAKLLDRIAQATTEGVVVNREDPLLHAVGVSAGFTDDNPAVTGGSARRVTQFGLSAGLRRLFPSDADFHSGPGSDAEAQEGADQGAANLEVVGLGHADVVLTEVGEREATFEIDGNLHRTPLELEGLYNTFNAAAALALMRMIVQAGPLAGERADPLGTATTESLVAALATVRPAFGRGEKLELDGASLELVLVKNPAGFRLALASFAAADVATMIAINDQYADGRDMSWLWDVDFTSLAEGGVDVVAGARAWDMTLRLEHDGVPVRETCEELSEALARFREASSGKPRRIFCTYTAMLALRKKLSELTEVENIW